MSQEECLKALEQFPPGKWVTAEDIRQVLDSGVGLGSIHRCLGKLRRTEWIDFKWGTLSTYRKTYLYRLRHNTP